FFTLRYAVARSAIDGAAVLSGIVRDVTDERRMRDELVEAKEVAEAASHAKSNFLAMMSHEIRTPMNGVLGMIDLLLGTELTAEQRGYAEVVRDSGDALLVILNDILDFSKIEAGKLDLEHVAMDVTDVVESAAELCAARAHAKGLEIGTLVAPDLQSSV